MAKSFHQSDYARLPDDNYQTIDTRCIQALTDVLGKLGKANSGTQAVDPCGRNGSALIDQLRQKGWINAVANGEAFRKVECDWIITNPPYARDAVDSFMRFFLDSVRRGDAQAAAVLLRTEFDHAASRPWLFDSPHYAGQIKMRFRPWWTESRAAQPQHSYVWHLWERNAPVRPVVYYWPSKEFGLPDLNPQSSKEISP